MKSITEFSSLYIYREIVDFRKSINGLSVIVQEDMKLNLKSNSLFIFCNKKRSHMKILYWDKSGFCLWLKKLEASKFPWPTTIEEEVILIKLEELKLVLDGINIWSRFKEVHFETVL